jgi:hypothetical protein
VKRDEVTRAVRSLADEFGVDPVEFAKRWVSYFPPPATNGNGHTNGTLSARAAPGGLEVRSGKGMALPKPVDWHYKPFIPLGRLALIDGRPSIGKGLWVAKMEADLLLTGGQVLHITAEEDPEEDVLRRLLAAGWDQETGEIDFFDGGLALPKQIDKLTNQVQAHPYNLVSFDPGRSFLANPDTGDRNARAEENMAPGLMRLNKVAKAQRCAMPFLHHWNRDSSAKASDRFSGSAAFLEKARHRITMAYVGKVDDGEGAIAVMKSNIAPEGCMIGYRIESVPEYDTARIVLGDPITDYPDLNAWWEAKSNVRFTIAEPPGDTLEAWCRKHLKRGDLLPSAPMLLADESLDLSAKKLQAASKALQSSGLLSKEGNRLMWRDQT